MSNLNIKKGQELNLSLEDILLLSCACSKLDNQARREIDFILDNDLDWEHILNMAKRHRLMPLLYINLNAVSPSKVPVDVLKDLKTNFHHNARRNLLLTGELIKVMQLLEDNGIKAVTYKGPVLAYSAYGNLGYRQFGDIDVFIDKIDVLNAQKVIKSNGYNLDSDIHIDTAIYKKFDWEYRFRSKQGVLIEINWKFEGPLFSLKADSKFLFNDLIKTKINNFEITTPSAENEFLMLSIHCAKHNWETLSWICDLSEVFQNKEINWKEVVDKASDLGVKRILRINFILLKELFRINIPEDINVNEDSQAYSMAMKIKRRLFNDNKISWNLFEKLILDLQKREDVYLGIKDCINGLSKPSIDDYKFLQLPESLFVLYIFIRPFLLLRKYGKGQI